MPKNFWQIDDLVVVILESPATGDVWTHFFHTALHPWILHLVLEYAIFSCNHELAPSYGSLVDLTIINASLMPFFEVVRLRWALGCAVVKKSVQLFT